MCKRNATASSTPFFVLQLCFKHATQRAVLSGVQTYTYTCYRRGGYKVVITRHGQNPPRILRIYRHYFIYFSFFDFFFLCTNRSWVAALLFFKFDWEIWGGTKIIFSWAGQRYKCVSETNGMISRNLNVPVYYIYTLYFNHYSSRFYDILFLTSE